jgi:glc operon protein GlcG
MYVKQQHRNHLKGRLASNPLDVIPEEIPFDVPYGLPISLDRAQAVIHAAMTEAKKRN